LLKKKLLDFSKKDVSVHKKVSKYDGFFSLDEYQVSHQLFNGGTSEVLSREIFERGDAVVLIPYDPILDKVVLIEQFRAGALRTARTPWLLEFIAGMFSTDESPIDVAIREAKEEANIELNPEQITRVMSYLSSPGGMSEEIHLFAGQVDSRHISGVYGLPEEGEDILVHVLTRVDAFALLEQGKINNAATVIGLQWLQLNYQQLQQRWY